MSEINNNLDIDSFADKFTDVCTPQEKNDIMVVGVGGGGGNAVNHMFREGVENVTFVVCNTDRMAVENSPVNNKVVIGDGRGAGNRPEKACKIAEDEIHKIESIFENQAKMVFVTAGMGGGTGTGAGPVVARVAKEKGLLTIGIVTIPFIFEGKKKIMKALDGADEMAKYVDALLVINNERLTEIYPDLDFFNAFAKADDTLSMAARSISELITIKGYINIDFEDVETTLRDGGTAIISTGYGEGEHRVTKAIEDALNSPLLKNRDIDGSHKLLINLYMSRGEGGNSMTMSEINELRDFVSMIDQNVDVIWGVTVDNTLGDQVKITILASGFDVTIRDEEDMILTPTKSNPTSPTPPKPQESKPSKSNPVGSSNSQDRLALEYGTKLDTLNKSYIVLSQMQMDDDSVIELLESNPTFNRDKRIVEGIKKGYDAQSQTAVSEDPTVSQTDASGGIRISF